LSLFFPSWPRYSHYSSTSRPPPPSHESFPLPTNNKLTEMPFLNQIEKFSKEKAGKYGAGMIDFHTTPLQR
jgi:hypothetical protein